MEEIEREGQREEGTQGEQLWLRMQGAPPWASSLSLAVSTLFAAAQARGLTRALDTGWQLLPHLPGESLRGLPQAGALAPPSPTQAVPA